MQRRFALKIFMSRLSKLDADRQQRYEECLKTIRFCPDDYIDGWIALSGFGMEKIPLKNGSYYTSFLPGYMYTSPTRAGLLRILKNEFESDKYLIGY